MSTKRFIAKHGLDNNNQTITNVATPQNSSDVVIKSVTDGILSFAQQAFNTANNTGTLIQPAFDAANTAASNTVYLFGALNQTNNNIISANTQLKSYTDGVIASSNTQLKSYTDGAISLANTQLKSYTDGAIASANTQLQSYVDGKSVYIGTTSVAFNRSSASQSLTGVNIDGSAGSVAAGNITGTTLASGVTASSLTSVGTLTSLTVSGTLSQTFNGAANYGIMHDLYQNSVGNSDGPKIGWRKLQTDNSTTTYAAGILNGSNEKKWALTTGSGTGFGSTLFTVDQSGNVNSIGSLSQNGNQVLHAGNYTSYSPSLTGSGASGSWGISVTGTASNITSYTINQNLGTSNAPSFDQVISTNNGNGTNFRIGDDAWIGDVNIANTFRVTGNQSGSAGYIIFGNGDSTALGRTGTAALTYGGNVVLTSANYSSYVSGFSSTDDTSTNATYYPVVATAAGGSTAKTSSTKLYFNPSTGTLSATIFNSLSDENVKENITQIQNASNIISQINGYEFDWKDNGEKSAGVIAQQVEKILPHLVTESEGNKSVNYSGLIGYLIESIKDQQKQIDELKSIINSNK